MYFLRLFLNENLETELFSISGGSFHAFTPPPPHIPNGLQVILKTICYNCFSRGLANNKTIQYKNN